MTHKSELTRWRWRCTDCQSHGVFNDQQKALSAARHHVAHRRKCDGYRLDESDND